MNQMLKDKVAIITGAGRGIGRAAALMFAAEGAKVVVSDRDTAPTEETVTDIKNAGGEAIAFVGDVTAPEFAEELIATAATKWNGLHIIVNNAGFTWDGVIHKMTDEMWNAMMEVHVTAPFRIIRAASPYFRDAYKKEMLEGKTIARKIVNVSSMSGAYGNAGQANYAAAKSAILGLTKTLSKEWGRFNVQANAVAFGPIETRLSKAKENGDFIEHRGQKVALGVPEALREAVKEKVPLGREGKPEEAAGAMLFFASPLSDYVSGQTLMVSGGL